jgi:hypothetical protein
LLDASTRGGVLECPLINFNNYQPGNSVVATGSFSDGWQRSFAQNSETYSSGRIVSNYGSNVMFQPYLLQTKSIVQGFGIDITTVGVAGDNFYAGLYNIGQDGLPGSQIVAFNPLSTAATGFITDTATSTWSPSGSFTCNAGWYYIGYGCGDGGTVQIAGRGSDTIYATLPGPLPMISGYNQGTELQGQSYTNNTALPKNPAAAYTINGGNNHQYFWFYLKLLAA